MKIFSPEASPKRKGAPEMQDQMPIGNMGSKSELQDKFSIPSLDANGDAKTAQMNNQGAFIAAPYPVCQIYGLLLPG